MILFALLLAIAIILTVVVFAAVSVGGSIFVIIFGDVLVCIGFIILILMFIFKRRRK